MGLGVLVLGSLVLTQDAIVTVTVTASSLLSVALVRQDEAVRIANDGFATWSSGAYR